MRRLLPALVGLVVVAGGLYGLMTVFSGRDDAGVGGGEAATGPGRLEPERERAPAAAGRPPTSGAFEPVNVTAEGDLAPDELLTALARGNVVLLHPGERPPAALRRLQREVSGPFDPELAAAGQTVVLSSWPGIEEIHALAWRRRLVAEDPQDPQLREFSETWLGQGRGNTG